MTTDFTASNGIRVQRDSSGGLSVAWEAPRDQGWTYVSTGEAKALREYFRTEILEGADPALIVHELYGPGEPEQWQLENAQSALRALMNRASTVSAAKEAAPKSASEHLTREALAELVDAAARYQHGGYPDRTLMKIVDALRNPDRYLPWAEPRPADQGATR